MKKLFLLIFSIGFGNCFGQMSGVFTIGGLNPDFSTINEAFDSLHNQGISGPVIFNIRPGIYYERINHPFQFYGADSVTVTFQSETLDSSDVAIINPDTIGGTFTLTTQDIIFRHLTIINNAIGRYVVYGNPYGQYENCYIKGIGYSLGYGAPGLNVMNCVVDGYFNLGGGGLIENNKFISNGGISWKICRGNTFNSNTSFSDGGTFENNIVYGKLTTTTMPNDGSLIVKDNLILDGASLAKLDIHSNKPDKFLNNIIQGEVHFSAGSHLEFISNHVLRRADLNFLDSSLIMGNKFSSVTNFNYGDWDTIQNNFFGDNTAFSFCNYSLISFNNFTSQPGKYIDGWSAGYSSFQNNIMPSNYISHDPLTIINNNCYPVGGGNYDNHPFFINPQYISSTDLHATNPQLMGKGIYDPNTIYDIDSLVRANPPTLGANEICISSDTLNIFCGDSIFLSFCNMPDSGSFFWQPITGLNDSHVSRPLLSSPFNNWYVVTDSLYGYTDSVYINVIPFNVNAVSNDDSIRCGYSVILNASYNASATYQWTPIDSLISPYTNLTQANPSQTTSYIVSATIAGCPISYDTVTVIVDPLPIAYAYLDSANYNFYSFLNASTCADSFYWYFGDSAFSSVTNPSHIYPDTGLFLVTLIACNSFGCDTFQAYISVDSVSFFTNIITDNRDLIFKLYPNPTPNSFTISLNELKTVDEELKIYDLTGREVFTTTLTSNHQALNPNLSSGVYFVKVTEGEKVFTQKLVIQSR